MRLSGTTTKDRQGPADIKAPTGRPGDTGPERPCGDPVGVRRVRAVLARHARSVGGVALLGVGLVLLVLPGPGLLVIAAALTLLAVDHPWARRLLIRTQGRIDAARARIRHAAARPRQSDIPPTREGAPGEPAPN